MSYFIFWSKEAELSYQSILEYLQNKWTTREIERFLARTEETINYIRKNPLLYPKIRNTTHKAVLSKHTSLFYKIEDTNIYLQFFWDNRQDPKRIDLNSEE